MSYKGRIFTQEHKNKISKSLKGHIPWNKNLTKETDERVKKYSVKLIGQKRTDEVRRKISLSNKGKTRSKGRIVSEETREKIRQANLGKKQSAELIEKRISQLRGKKRGSRSIEIRNKISKALKGIKLSEEMCKLRKEVGNRIDVKEKIRKARLKQILPKKDTSIEIKLQDILDKNNIKYEKHKLILGQPDIFIEPNICIFADGDYWHHYPKGNIRDKNINKELKNQGYIVLRFWEHDINNNINMCIEIIKQYVK